MTAISISDIKPSSQARVINNGSVASLAESMNEIGLRTPITVKPCSKFFQGKEIAAYEIVTGRHRLEAAKMLGWEEIEATVMTEDIRTCRLWEISENLHRAELTELERGEMVAEWVELTGFKPEQNVQVSVGGRGNKDGISQAARQLPLDGKTENAKRMNVVRSIKVASLSPEAKAAARDSGLDDNQSALLDAAKQKDPAAQVETIRARAKKKPKKSDAATTTDKIISLMKSIRGDKLALQEILISLQSMLKE